jgi:hypothetical protein
MRLIHALIFTLALLLAATLATRWGFLTSALFVVLMATILNRPKARLCLTLSVAEILMDTLEAFKTELPGMLNYASDFSTKNAVKGDKITAHLALKPTVRDVDPVTGFANSAALAENLLEDVSVTLDQLKHVPVRVNMLSQLAAKKDLYKVAIRDQGYVLAKHVVDAALTKAATNFSNSLSMAPALVDVDALETIRNRANAQGMSREGRYGVVSTPFASALQNDPRTGSKQFNAQLNGAQGYRVFKNIGGFEVIWEYPDLPAGVSGFFGDRRAIGIATAMPHNLSHVARDLGIPEVMRMDQVTDPETGLQMSGVSWQAPGTGDLFLTTAILFGLVVGNDGGAPGAVVDNAGLLVRPS